MYIVVSCEMRHTQRGGFLKCLGVKAGRRKRKRLNIWTGRQQKAVKCRQDGLLRGDVFTAPDPLIFKASARTNAVSPGCITLPSCHSEGLKKLKPPLTPQSAAQNQESLSGSREGFIHTCMLQSFYLKYSIHRPTAGTCIAEDN